VLGETAGAESFADDVLCAEAGSGDRPPAALVEQADEEAALARRVDDDAAASALAASIAFRIRLRLTGTESASRETARKNHGSRQVSG